MDSNVQSGYDALRCKAFEQEENAKENDRKTKNIQKK